MVKRGKKKILLIILLSILILLLIPINLYLIRAFSQKQLDDVTPGIQCDETLLDKADVLYIIPKFNNISINQTWCREILALNKTLALHGVYHTYMEFNEPRTKEYSEEGIKIFQDCFNQTPTMFKPPQMKISKENIKLIKEENLTLISGLNQLLHKAYHCNDTGEFKNRIISDF